MATETETDSAGVGQWALLPELLSLVADEVHARAVADTPETADYILAAARLFRQTSKALTARLPRVPDGAPWTSRTARSLQQVRHAAVRVAAAFGPHALPFQTWALGKLQHLTVPQIILPYGRRDGWTTLAAALDKEIAGCTTIVAKRRYGRGLRNPILLKNLCRSRGNGIYVTDYATVGQDQTEDEVRKDEQRNIVEILLCTGLESVVIHGLCLPYPIFPAFLQPLGLTHAGLLEQHAIVLNDRMG